MKTLLNRSLIAVLAMSLLVAPGCKKWARTAKGGAIGAGVGGVIGGAIGSDKDKTVVGAIIGYSHRSRMEGGSLCLLGDDQETSRPS